MDYGFHEALRVSRDLPMALRAAAILLWFNGLGFGLCCLPGIRNLLTGRDIPTIFGFPAYGGGPFERAGIPTTVPLLSAFLIVCALEVVAGWLTWQGSSVGAIAAIVLAAPGAVFWYGFALPIPPLLAAVRTALIVMSWQDLT
jgi:hypothetical protein